MRNKIQTNNTRPTIIKGITPEQLKKLSKNKGVKIESQNMKIINSKGRVNITGPKTINGVKIKENIKMTPRPDSKFLVNLATDVKRFNLPEKGAFNPGLVKIPNSTDYVMVYRPDEYGFIGCILDENLDVKPNSYYRFNITNCADPRIVWTPDGKLLMIYSSTTKVGFNYECIRGDIIMDLNDGVQFIDTVRQFRVSPDELTTRQKNWMPFVHDGEIFLIASICPHIVYKFDLNTLKAKKVCEQQWANPWFYPDDFLRGNTNPVQLEDGNYLGTFHTAVWNDKRCYYDNGCYVFSGQFPFNVLKCSNKTYLPAEGAIEPYFRNGHRIVCTFPVGMVREDNNILIAYGDNDSVVKIMKTTVDDMLKLTLDVY